MKRTAEEPPPREDGKARRKGYIQAVLVVAFIGGAFLFSRYLASLQHAPDPGRTDQRHTFLVRTEVVEPQMFRLRFSATGTVQVRALTDIVPQVSGRVESIDDCAFPGGVFTPETVLFRIEEEDFRNELDRMQAEVARARTQLKVQQAASEAAREEWRQLNPNTPVPPLVAEQPQLEEARANLQAAQAALKTARLNLARTRYQLPFEGRVIEFQLEQGQYVVAGQSYGQAYRVKSLEIDVPLPEQQLAWLLEAEEPQIRVSSDFRQAEVYRAHIKRVAAKVDMQTRFARVVLGLEETAPDLIPDVFVRVRFVGPERENVWVLPLDALQADNLIWVVGEDKTLRSLQPPVIQITEDHVVAESNGATIRVVVGNLPQATEGAEVEIVEE